MGSAEESTASPAATAKPSLPPASNPTSAAATMTTTSAPAGPPAPYPEWAASVQAFYTSGAPAAASPAFFSPAMASSPLAQPYVWGGQPVLTPYGTPIYSPMYFQGGSYAHPSMAMAAGPPYPALEAEGRPRSAEKTKGGDAAETGKSGDEEDDDSQSESEGEGEGSSETREESINPQDSSAARKRNLIEASQHSTAAPSSSTTVESTYSGRGQTSGKLPVSAPGRVVLPGPAPNLNIGMDHWNPPHADAAMKARPNAVNIVPAMASSMMAGRKGVLPDQQWVQQDERELKRQRRKQSNRESARRSRLRKQQECEELARRVDELSNENSSLRSELEQLNKDCRDLEVENASIVEELTRVYGAGALSTFEGFNNDSTSIDSVDGECRNRAH